MTPGGRTITQPSRGRRNLGRQNIIDHDNNILPPIIPPFIAPPIQQSLTTMSEASRKIPTLEVKLSGPSTYPEWIISLQNYLDLVPARGEYRVWDIVTGEYQEPPDTSDKIAVRAWKDTNSIALLTLRKNCEDNVRARIGNLSTAKEAFDELKRAFEGRTTTEFYALLDSITSIHFDDRKSSIEEHVVRFERAWNIFAGIIVRADLIKDDGFGEGLQKFAKSDTAKTEYLLRSLPSFYANTIEKIRAKEYRYDDVSWKLREYISIR